MSSTYDPLMLPLAGFARSGANLQGAFPLLDLARLRAQSVVDAADAAAHFDAKGSERFDATGHPQIWLHISGNCRLTMECQRCLRPAGIDLAFERDFRFVANEALAAVEDEESEEDVLVFERQFNLRDLVEDELLMAIPLVPMHPSCPETPRFSVADADFDAAAQVQTNPFAVLAGLKRTSSPD
jgi:uncharacterized protein